MWILSRFASRGVDFLSAVGVMSAPSRTSGPAKGPRTSYSNSSDYQRQSSGRDFGSGALKKQKEDFRDYLKLPIEERRKKYKTSYIPLDDIPTWPEYFDVRRDEIISLKRQEAVYRTVDDAINSKVSIFAGDITKLEIDAIVNAANERLLGGGGVDGAIHRAAGPKLLEECRALNGCSTGKSKITFGYNLPATHIIHTVGPQSERAGALKSCYETSLELLLKHKLRTIAFPCISTGIYGYPNGSACKVALNTIRSFLELHAAEVDRIIFCLFLPVDQKCYNEYFPMFFPVGNTSASG